VSDTGITLGNADAYKATQAKANKLRTDSLTKAQKQATKGKSKQVADKQPAKMGRPSMYSEEMRDRICLQLANGITMAKICQQPDMPSFDTVWKWTTRHPDFADATARAREIGTHFLADDCIAIADNPELDPADKRIMIDTRVRLIGKWNQYYSDKAKVEISGKIDVAPVDVHQLDYDQREALAGMLEQIALPNPDQDDEL